MTKEEYTIQVREILEEYTDSARENLQALSKCLPSKTTAIELTIFVDQDGEGFLTVRIALDGPDLYVLNKGIENCALLFDTKMGSEGLEPPLPLMEPLEEDFSVHDSLTDCATDWLLSVWDGLEKSSFDAPISIVSHDGYGTKDPISL